MAHFSEPHMMRVSVALNDRSTRNYPWCGPNG